MLTLSFYHLAALVAVAMFLCAFGVVLFLVYRPSDLGGARGDDAQAFPPHASTCPNRWEHTQEGKCALTVSKNTTAATAPINAGVFLASSSNTTEFSKAKVDEAKNNDFCASVAIQKADDDEGTQTLSFDPNDTAFSKGKPAVCGRKQFAAAFGIEWEGVSNYNKCEMFTTDRE